MDKVAFRYGRDKLYLSIPDDAQSFGFREPVQVVSGPEFKRDLGTLIGDRQVFTDVAVVVADKTRMCGYERILPYFEMGEGPGPF